MSSKKCKYKYKVKYETHAAAKAVADALTHKAHGRLRHHVYACAGGQHYHISTNTTKYRVR